MSAMLAGSLAGPAVVNASAASAARASRPASASRTAALTRQVNAVLARDGITGREAAVVRTVVLDEAAHRGAQLPAPAAGSDPISFLVNQVVSEIQFDTSPANVQSILEQLTGAPL